MIKATSIPMGNSIFVTWPQIDNLFDAWAKSYFGEHVKGSGERDDTDCYVAILGLKDTDENKFSQLFDKYDKDRDYDPYYEFCTGEQKALLPDCITRGVMSEAFKDLSMKSIGKLLAIQDGVFLMENELNYFDFVVGRSNPEISADKTSLDAQIQSASTRATESRPTSKVKANEPEPEI